jgi:hypothetical protein
MKTKISLYCCLPDDTAGPGEPLTPGYPCKMYSMKGIINMLSRVFLKLPGGTTAAALEPIRAVTVILVIKGIVCLKWSAQCHCSVTEWHMPTRLKYITLKLIFKLAAKTITLSQKMETYLTHVWSTNFVANYDVMMKLYLTTVDYWVPEVLLL